MTMRAKSWGSDELNDEPVRAVAGDPYEAAAQMFEATSIPISAFYDDPVGFMDEFVIWPAPPPGQDPGLTDYQRECMGELVTQKRIAVRGPHGLGKTASNALLVIWFAITRDDAGVDWKAITTAGAWRQLEFYLWPEIRKWAGCLDWAKLGMRPWKFKRELMTLSLKLKHGEGFAVASSDHEKIEGAHADSVLFIFDESKAIRAEVFNAAEGAFSAAGGKDDGDTSIDATQPGGPAAEMYEAAREEGRALEALVVATSTPGEPSGTFYDIHTQKPGYEDWWTRHVTLDEVVAAKRVSPAWARQRALQWGEESALYANRVLGEFHSSAADSVIPLAWVEAAVERWYTWSKQGRRKRSKTRVLGVDVALGGADMTAIAIRRGVVCEKVERLNTADTIKAAAQVSIRMDGADEAVVDTIGVGAGVVDQLRLLGTNVRTFIANAKSFRRDRTGDREFVNRRAEIWWLMRERLDPAFDPEICLPDDPLLIAELTAPKWKEVGGGKIQVEAKEDIKKRLGGRSTDSADAVLQTWASPESIDDGLVDVGATVGTAERYSDMSDVERFMSRGGDTSPKSTEGGALPFGSTTDASFFAWEQEL
jgi:hypothetical protein